MVCPSPKLGTVDWSCKPHTESFPEIFFFIIKSPITNCIGYFDQVIVFGTLYAKTFLKNPPQKPSLPEPTGNGATSPVKQNPV